MQLSAVVPCYNEQAVLPELHRRLSSACSDYEQYELILVDDGSRDQTWIQICGLAALDRHVVGVRLSRNHGHQLALTAGLARARGERIFIIDGDLQDPPELLPQMMSRMDEGADVVYGQRSSRRGVAAWKRIAYKLYYKLLSRLAGSDIPPDTGDFRLVTRRVVDLLNQMPEHHRFLRGMVSWVGFTQVPLYYARDERFAGKSQYTLPKLFRLALDGITSFSIKPLRIASVLSLLLAFGALAGLAYIAASWWMARPVQGWTSLVVTILFLGAMQLLVLGIIGEYLGRLFMESKGRPLFIVAELIGHTDKQQAQAEAGT